MIESADLLYYTEPLPQPVIPTEVKPGTKVLVTKSRYPHADTRPGSIVEVDRVTVDSSVWWRTTMGGRDVFGHVINDPNLHRRIRLRIAPISDELFALVNVIDRRNDLTVTQCEVIALSNPNVSPSFNTEYGLFPFTIPAASWAREYMPRAGDSDDVVERKVKLARLKWEHKAKAIRIIEEGHERSWLQYLNDLRTAHPTYMPQPRFDLYVQGTVIFPTGANANAEVVRQARQRIESRTGTVPPAVAEDQSTLYVGAPLSALVPLEANYEAAYNTESNNSAIRSHVTNIYGDRSVSAVPTNSYPILRSVIF